MLQGKGKKALSDFPYRLRDDFLSPAERSFYITLRASVEEWADVCPKVNLGDLFYAACKNFGERQSYTNRINRKHIDFLICDKKTARPMLGIELDDKSHNQATRQERDHFVETVFKVANLPLERISVKNAYNPKELNAQLAKFAGIQTQPIVKEAEIVLSDKDIGNVQICPKCSSEMTLRTAKSGANQGQQFWGCTNFPKCRTILSFSKK